MLRKGNRPEEAAAGGLEHDPEKWVPVFRKDRAQTKRWSGMTINP
jgi:hypothetical protein